MKLTINKTQTYAHEIEVTFPLYTWDGDAYDAGGGYDTYAKIEQDGTRYSVTKRMVGAPMTFDYSFDKCKIIFLVELDRHLKYHKSTEFEFQQMVAEAKASLDGFPKESKA